MQFVLRGKSFNIDPEDVKKAVKNLQPESIRKYALQIGNSEYPIKQVLSKITGYPPAAFTAHDAYRILGKMGFTIKQYQEFPPWKNEKKSLALPWVFAESVREKFQTLKGTLSNGQKNFQFIFTQAVYRSAMNLKNKDAVA